MEVYKGYEVEFNESKDLWQAGIDGETEFENQSLKEIKKLIDKQAKKKFQRVKIFVQKHPYDYPSELKIVTLTSLSIDGSLWITDEDGEREKIISRDDGYVYNEKNRKIAEDMGVLVKKRGEIDKMMRGLEEGLELVRRGADE